MSWFASVVELSEEVCRRRGRGVKQSAHDTCFDRGKSRSQEGKEEQEEVSEMLLLLWFA